MSSGSQTQQNQWNGIFLKLKRKLATDNLIGNKKDLLWGLLLNGAQGGTRTRTLANYPLKVACLPVPPPGQRIDGAYNIKIFLIVNTIFEKIF